MAKLDASERNALPKSNFGLPAQGKYPMPDVSHAQDAKGRATQMLKRGIISDAQHAKITAKANKIIGKDASGGTPMPRPTPKKAKAPPAAAAAPAAPAAMDETE